MRNATADTKKPGPIAGARPHSDLSGDVRVTQGSASVV